MDSGTVDRWSDSTRKPRGTAGGMRNVPRVSNKDSSVLLSSAKERKKKTSGDGRSGSNSADFSGIGISGSLPPILGRSRGHSNAVAGSLKSKAAGSGRKLTPPKGRKATGSPLSTMSGSKKTFSRGSSSSSRGSISRKGVKQRRRSSSPGAKQTRGGSRASSGGSSRRRLSKGKGRGRRGSSHGRKDPKGKKGVGRSKSTGSCTRMDVFTAAVSALEIAENGQRAALVKGEEVAREEFLPDYHLLVMNLVRAQVVQVNQRQQQLNDAFKTLQAHGINVSSGQDIDTALQSLLTKMQTGLQKQVDEIRIENAALSNLLEEKKMELEQKVADEQSLRDKVTRRLARFEVETESLKAEVQSALQTSFLDVDRMRRELGHRLDLATASLRTPKYDTALRSMQDLVCSVQEEIQNHHDTMSKLIVSLEAQDTFLRDKNESMHSRFPTRYRDELRKLEKDQLLNLLDVLSFHDVVVETAGKALYILKKEEHNTNVF